MAGPRRERIFLYGTLRRGGSRDAREHYAGVEFVAPGRVRGWLHDFTDYPGLRLDAAAGWVRGEIFAVTAGALAGLDEWEGLAPGQRGGADASAFTGEYRRVKVTVDRADHGREVCWVYEVNGRRCAGRPVIASGDWLSRG